MFVVRRSFRGPHGPLKAGSVVEPVDMKDFRYRLQQKHVVEVNEQNFDKYQKFFNSKYNVTLKPLAEPVVEPKVAPVVEPNVEPIVIKATANE